MNKSEKLMEMVDCKYKIGAKFVMKKDSSTSTGKGKMKKDDKVTISGIRAEYIIELTSEDGSKMHLNSDKLKNFVK